MSTPVDTPLSAEQREQLRTLAESATSGPWRSLHDGFVHADVNGESNCLASAWLKVPPFGIEVEQQWRNAAYIAAASPDVVLSLLTERDRLAAQLAEATTPDIVSLDDYTEYAEQDFDGLRETIAPNDFRPLDWANRTLGQWYAAHIVDEWEDDFESPAESHIALFATESEARAAVSVLPKPVEAPSVR